MIGRQSINCFYDALDAYALNTVDLQSIDQKLMDQIHENRFSLIIYTSNRERKKGREDQIGFDESCWQFTLHALSLDFELTSYLDELVTLKSGRVNVIVSFDLISIFVKDEISYRSGVFKIYPNMKSRDVNLELKDG